jgi:phage terminase Nu1 subunit (DNA packaging protein)
MEVKNTMHISYNKLSELTGFSYRTVRERLFELKPAGKGLTGKPEWESREALPLLYTQNGKMTTDKDTEGEKIDLNAEKARLAKEQADSQAMKNAIQRGELIPSSMVAETWSRIVNAAKLKFLALPDRLSQMLETASTIHDRRKIIDAEIRNILEDLSNQK